MLGATGYGLAVQAPGPSDSAASPAPQRLGNAQTRSESGLHVTVTKPVASIRFFDPKDRPRDLPPMRANEVAVTSAQFGSNARISTQFAEQPGRPSRWTVTLDGVEITTRLEVTIWLPERYTRREKEHEDGHRRISETVYARLAEKTARQAGARYLGMSLRATGSMEEAKSEAKDVIGKALEDIASRWLRVVLGMANRVNDRFDELTDHGRKDMPVDIAIKLAFSKEAGSPAAR